MKSTNISVRLLSLAAAVACLLWGSPALADLIGYWNLDNNVLDSSSAGNNGSVFGTTAYASDTPTVLGGGQSFSFNGSSSIQLPFMNFYGLSGTGGATLSFWVKAAPQNDRRVFGEAIDVVAGSANDFHGLGATNATGNNKLRWYMRNGSTGVLDKTSSITAFDSTWHHVVWVDLNGSSRLYIDGVLDSTIFNYSHTASGINTTTIGAVDYNGTHAFAAMNGLMDDVAMWNAVLPESAIIALANGASPLAVAPEPSTWLMLASGALLGFLGVWRRRRAWRGR